MVIITRHQRATKAMPKIFNIARAWKEIVGRVLGSDGVLEWSREDAALLKRKSDSYERTPHELAAEARRLAINPYVAVRHPDLDGVRLQRASFDRTFGLERLAKLLDLRETPNLLGSS